MNSRKPLLILAVFGLVGTLFMLSVSAKRENDRGVNFPSNVGDGSLPELYSLPDFELIDSTGATFTREDLAGKFWVADFIFTTCAGPCPVMTNRMADVYSAFQDNPEVSFLSISVNPEYDTPEVLRAYAEKHGADTSRWRFLTGDREEIHRLAVEGFKLGSVEEPIFHSTRFVLVDDTGVVRAYYEGTEPEGCLELTRDLSSLLN